MWESSPHSKIRGQPFDLDVALPVLFGLVLVDLILIPFLDIYLAVLTCYRKLACRLDKVFVIATGFRLDLLATTVGSWRVNS